MAHSSGESEWLGLRTIGFGSPLIYAFQLNCKLLEDHNYFINLKCLVWCCLVPQNEQMFTELGFSLNANMTGSFCFF